MIRILRRLCGLLIYKRTLPDMLQKTVTFFGGLVLCTIVHANGKQLHDAACLQCHASLSGGDAYQLYSRDEKNIKSLAALEKRVSYCAKAADVSWNEQQKRAVVDYLNSTFYHLK
mgnify:FL=1